VVSVISRLGRDRRVSRVSRVRRVSRVNMVSRVRRVYQGGWVLTAKGLQCWGLKDCSVGG
jgi:hypothetical protein